MEYNLEDEISPPLPKLLLVVVVYHRDKKKLVQNIFSHSHLHLVLKRRPLGGEQQSQGPKSQTHDKGFSFQTFSPSREKLKQAAGKVFPPSRPQIREVSKATCPKSENLDSGPPFFKCLFVVLFLCL